MSAHEKQEYEKQLKAVEAHAVLHAHPFPRAVSDRVRGIMDYQRRMIGIIFDMPCLSG